MHFFHFIYDFTWIYMFFVCRKKGKGKKGGKKSESIAKIAAANSKVWEARLDIAEKSKQEYR